MISQYNKLVAEFDGWIRSMDNNLKERLDRTMKEEYSIERDRYSSRIISDMEMMKSVKDGWEYSKRRARL